MSPEMVEGFAKLVAGAVAGLKPHNVYITDARTLRSYNVPHPEDAVSFDLLNMIKRREEHYRAKILSKLGDIPGVQVAVTVELDMSKRVTQNVKHDLPQPKMETSNATEQNAASEPTEPGVQANLGQALTAAAAGQSQSSEETVVENFEPKRSQTETIEQMPFATKKVSAAVGIPRSFIASVFKARFPNVSEAPKDDDPQLTAVREEQIARVRSSVQRMVMAKGPEDVEVDVYPDMEWTAEGGTWNRAPGGVILAQSASGGEAFDTMSIVRAYAPQAGLATLALMSLLMMMRMVRKSSEAIRPHGRPGSDAGGRGEEDRILTVGPAPVGKAAISEGLLAGKELDPRTLHHQELAQEVSRMVEQDPVGAAELLRRWMQNGK
jgi:flagellar biosynthesis/type III secretory pathway M-ring protein FliF/YscJ